MPSFATFPHLSYKIAEFNFPNLKVAGIAPIPTDGLRIGVRKDWPILIGYFGKSPEIDQPGGTPTNTQAMDYAKPA